MKISFFKKSIITLSFLLTIGIFASCGSGGHDDPGDNNDKDNEVSIPNDAGNVETFKFDGRLISEIPAIPDFQPSVSPDRMEIQKYGANNISIYIGGYKVTVGEMGRDIEIGGIIITEVPCEQDNGTYRIPTHEFTTQAGSYVLTGTIEGDFDREKADVTLIYKPGSMPFDVQSRFVSGNE